MAEEFDQIKMDLDSSKTDITKIAKPVEAKEAHSKKTKRPADPQSLSIDAELFDNDEEDALVSPKKDVFDKLTGNYTKEFHNSENDGEDNLSIDDSYKSTSKSDQQFFSTFGLSSGNQSVIAIDEKTGQSSSEIDTLQGDIHSDYYEYTDRQQRKEIVGMYKFAKKNIKTKTILASIFAIILFFIENFGLFIKNPTGILANPYVVTVSNIVVFLACVAFAYEQLYHGIKSIFSKDYIPESVVIISVACAIVHSLLTLLFISFENEPKLYNFPVAISVIMVLLYSYINVAREKYGFSVISSKDVKFYLEKVIKGDDEAETETFSSTAGEFEGEIARVRKTAFVKGYFANTNSTPNLHSYLGIYYTFSLFVPAILAIISLFRGFDFFKAITIWYVGVLFMLPVCVLFSYSVPFLIGNRRLYNDEVAIIGENAINEFATTNVVSVNDTTAFLPYNVKLRNFQVFNDFKTEKVLYYAASGFATVGGPLSYVFDAATKDAFQKSKRTKFVCSGRSYLCVKIDGDTIIFADRYGMSSQGIDVGMEKEEDDDISVMYMACNGTLCSKMYLKYTIDEEFVNTALFLNKNKVGIGIRTFDPNINNELIKWQVNQRKFDIKAIRLTSEDEVVTTSARSEGRIVTRGHSKSLLKAIPVCKRIAKIRKVTRAFKVISSIFGATLVGLYIFGKVTATASALIAGYYLALILMMTLITLVAMPSQK